MSTANSLKVLFKSTFSHSRTLSLRSGMNGPGGNREVKHVPPLGLKKGLRSNMVPQQSM